MSQVIRGVLLEEQERLKRLLKRYSAELDVLPRGSVRQKVIKGKEYAYLVYREGKKVINEYLGSAERKDVQKIMSDAVRAKKIKDGYKDVQHSLKDLERMLRGRTV
jgi:hypothetical protein